MFIFEREKILSVRIIPDEPSVKVRLGQSEDKKSVITSKDGKKRTLWCDKLTYPFIITDKVSAVINTSKRSFRVVIPQGYVWNGADIPTICEPIFGAKQEPSFMVPSLVHDYMCEFKQEIFSMYFSENDTMADYRRLTSLILRQLFKDYGCRVVKANLGAFLVDFYQATFNRGSWSLEG